MASRTVSFLERVSREDLIAILETQLKKNSKTNDQDCTLSQLTDNGKGYCQVTIPADVVKKVLHDGDPSPGAQLKISIHQIAAHVQSGARPESNDAHHACRNRNCFRWTLDRHGRMHIEWVHEDIHKTIMCPISLTIDVECGQCGVTLKINVCTDPITPPHLGPSCF